MIASGPTNVPCARCGAPMREQAELGHLAAEVAMQCGCCGAVERLPRAAEARVLALRNLLVERQWAADAACGPAVTYVRALANPGPYVAPYAFVALLALIGALRTPSQWGVLSVGAIGGAAVAAWIAARIARRRLDVTVAPLIRSFPGSAGHAARCRRCGGELPPHAGGFVVCGYCEAPNLISRDAGAARATELGGEIDDVRAYAAETAQAVTAAGTFVSRLFRGAFFAGVAGGLAIAGIVAAARLH